MATKVLKEKFFPIMGTTKLRIGDPMYFEQLKENPEKNKGCKKLIYDGNISAAPLGLMKVTQNEVTEDDLTWEDIVVEVYTGSNIEQLKVYANEQYFGSDTLKKKIDLACDSASFEIETKYGYQHFHTGADGYYGNLLVFKQYYGMNLFLAFDADLFEFDDIVSSMLDLFPRYRQVELEKLVNSLEAKNGKEKCEECSKTEN